MHRTLRAWTRRIQPRSGRASAKVCSQQQRTEAAGQAGCPCCWFSAASSSHHFVQITTAHGLICSGLSSRHTSRRVRVSLDRGSGDGLLKVLETTPK